MGVVFVISGPAGVGKTTLCDRLIGEFSDKVKRIVTVTTRKPRTGEVNGQDYHFLSKDEFLERVNKGAFIEYECVHDNFYGTLKETVISEIEDPEGGDLLLNIDVNGASSLKQFAETTQSLKGLVFSVFVNPSSMEQLRGRLRNRGSDDSAEIEKRLKTAGAEIKRIDHFDFVLPSGDHEQDYEKLREFYQECSSSSQSED